MFLTGLVGRDREVEQVTELLGAARLISLVGPGGTGKTRLAAAVAERAAESGGRDVAWVDLTPLVDAAAVAPQVASVLGLREQPGRAVEQALLDRLAPSRLLLVLDNCEHLHAATARLVDMLLRGCPGLGILTTTREPLRTPGEKAWRVPPLEVPSTDVGGAAAPAVQLFAARAADALPSFRVTADNLPAVVRICRRVDGLPLAIELAAARIPVLPPEQLADRLDDMFRLLASRSAAVQPRHRTLRALIDWSYDLLSPPERALFDGLSVFVGGFSLDAAERVTCDHCAGGDVLDLLAALVEKSLVVMQERNGEARYSLLETVRTYATGRLGEHPGGGQLADRLRLQHARYYADLLEALAAVPPRAWQAGQARLEAEHDNVRAALTWALSRSRADLALRLCIGMREFWRARGHLTEASGWTRRALECGRAEALEALRTRALVAACVYDRMRGEYSAIQSRLAEAEATARRLADDSVLADVLTQLGLSLRDRGEIHAARARLDEALDLWRRAGDPRGLGTTLGARASVALAEGNTAHARALRTEAAEVARAAGDPECEAFALIGLGEVARMEGNLEEARSCNERCLVLFDDLGDAWHAAAAWHNLGWIEGQAGRDAAAAAAFGRCIALFRNAGNPFGLTLCLFGLARLLSRAGDLEAAAVTLAAASAQAAKVGVRPAAPADVIACEETAAEIRAALAPGALQAAMARGERMTLTDGLAWAQERLAVLAGGEAEAPPVHATARARPVPPERRPHAAPGKPRGATSAAGAAVEADPDLRVLALGPLRIFVEGVALDGASFGSSKPLELLLLLLSNPEGLTREQAGLAFWPDASTTQVKNSFHVTLHRLRKALGRPEWIILDGDRYRLDPAIAVDFDAERFETDVRTALQASSVAGDAEMRLTAALALCRGEFLEGSSVGDWHLEIRDRLRRLEVEAWLAVAALRMAGSRHDLAAEGYRAVLTRDRLNEEACRGLMICQARTGQRVQALRLYETFSLLLQEELGARPDPETAGLYERLQLSGTL